METPINVLPETPKNNLEQVTVETKQDLVETLNTLKENDTALLQNDGTREYLRQDIQPIMTSIGMSNEHQDESGKLQRLFRNETVPGVEDLFFAANPRELSEKSILNGGDMTYLISQIDNKDKFSMGYFNCTGLIVIGRDKVNHENISFMSHEDPDRFLKDKKDQFLQDLSTRLDDLKAQCEEGTIDAVIIGGNYMKDRTTLSSDESGLSVQVESSMADYVKSINLLNEVVVHKLGFQPFVPIGPKTTDGCDSIFLDNKNRRVFIGRSETDMPVHPGYEAHNIQHETEKGKWSS